MTPRQANLLDDLSEAIANRDHALTRDQAEAARADIASITHSLWLSGWSSEDDEVLPGKPCADAQTRSPQAQHSNERKDAA